MAFRISLTAALVFVVAAIACFVGGIWTGDLRWTQTAFAFVALAVVAGGLTGALAEAGGDR